jgi:hypothetical protein
VRTILAVWCAAAEREVKFDVIGVAQQPSHFMFKFFHPIWPSSSFDNDNVAANANAHGNVFNCIAV